MRHGALAISALAPCWLSSKVNADTLVVPDHYVTIQAAIDASADGDTVLVRPGTYLENLLVFNKSLAITSVEGPEVTIIDGRFSPRPDTLSVVYAAGADQLLLAGFTIRNGLGGSPLPEPVSAKCGGGLLLVGVGAVSGMVKDCIIQDNYAEHDGGGIYLFGSVVVFEDCVVRNSQCDREGGGVFALHTSARLERCTIEDNNGPKYGGVFSGVGEAEFVDCIIRRNRSATEWVLGGDGRYKRTVVSDNGFLGPPGPDQVGILASLHMESCTIVRNESYWWTVRVPTGGVLSRSIIAFNEARGVSCSEDVAIECSDVFGNQGGDELCGSDLGGNFHLDPLLCVDNSIADRSPCAAGQSPDGCGLVGALDVGCVASVAEATWGGIKAAYRRQ